MAMSPTPGTKAFEQWQNQWIRNQVQQVSPMFSAQSAGGIDPNAEREAGFTLTEGRAEDILNDPYMSMALQAYQNAMSGGPFTDEVMSGITGQLADQAATSEQVQRQQLLEQLAATGGSMNDPSAMAAGRDLTEQRHLGLADAQRELLIEQALSNYQAQQQAAQQLAALRQNQYSLGNPLAMQAAQMHMSSYDEPRTGGVLFQSRPQESQPRQQGMAYLSGPDWTPSQGYQGSYSQPAKPSYSMPEADLANPQQAPQQAPPQQAPQPAAPQAWWLAPSFWSSRRR